MGSKGEVVRMELREKCSLGLFAREQISQECRTEDMLERKGMCFEIEIDTCQKRLCQSNICWSVLLNAAKTLKKERASCTLELAREEKEL